MTVVLLTDRNDLDDQLFTEVFAPDELLPEKPVQAKSAGHLRNCSNDLVAASCLPRSKIPSRTYRRTVRATDRSNVIVIADEAHRSQYDFVDGFARHLRDGLPNATFIGFTGTPIDQDDRSTREVFGEYVSVYDLTRAVNDGATVRVYYESRLAKVKMTADARAALDEGVEEVLETEEDASERSREVSLGTPGCGGWCVQAHRGGCRRPRGALGGSIRHPCRQSDGRVHVPPDLC